MNGLATTGALGVQTAVGRRPQLRDLVALTKPRITMLNLIATAGGYWLAPSHPGVGTFLLTLLGTSLVVGAANALNCYLERDIDRHMARTRTRPLPAGRIAPMSALLFGLALAAVGVPTLTFGVNPIAGLIALLAVVGYVLVYTPMKQKSPLALLVGAVPGAAPPLIGWAAATSGVNATGMLLFLLVFLWQVPHFLAITLFRARDYAEAGLKVLPNEVGERATRVELFRYLLALVATSLGFVVIGASHGIYLAAALALGGGLVLLAVRGLREDPGPKWARAFFGSTNLYLMLLLGALIIDRYLA